MDYKQKYLKYKKKYISLLKGGDFIEKYHLTQDSNRLLTELVKINFSFSFTDDDINSLSSIYQLYAKIYKQIDKHNITTTLLNDNNFSLIKHCKGSYFDEDISKDIFNMQNLFIYECNNNHHKFIIHTSDINNMYLKVAFSIISLCKYNKKCIIGLFPTDNKKLFPKITGDPITKKNINSGFCYPNNYCVIFRKEEMKKVMIHELLHHCCIELDTVIDIDTIKKYFNYVSNKNLYINEAYIEFFACILNLCHIVVYLNLTIEDFIFLLKYEIIFSLLQLAKLLIHFNIHSYDHFFVSNMDNIHQNKVYAENTHPDAYILVKTAFLFYIRESIELFTKNGKNMFNPNNNICDYTQIHEYVIDICGRKTLSDAVNFMIKNIDGLDDFTKKTCRLTCIEINPK